LDEVAIGDFYSYAFEDKYPKAVICLRKDEEKLLTFYDFPAAFPAHQNHESDRIEHLQLKNSSDDVRIITAGGEGMVQTVRIQRDLVCIGREAIP